MMIDATQSCRVWFERAAQDHRRAQHREWANQLPFDYLHDRASDNLHFDFDLSDQIYVGGYCIDSRES